MYKCTLKFNRTGRVYFDLYSHSFVDQSEIETSLNATPGTPSRPGLLSVLSTHSFILLINDQDALTIVRYLTNQRSLLDSFEIYLAPVR